jgi:hypothetical protein
MGTAQTGRTHGRSDHRCKVKILLANPEPSTHGPTRTSSDVCFCAALKGIADIKRALIAASQSSYTVWLFGFMTAANAALVAEGKSARNIGARSPRELKMSMRLYCNAHPLADYIDGAFELFTSLPEMPKDK